MKIENAETRRPNREAIAAYKESLGAKSGKLKEGDTGSADEELKEVVDDEELDLNVLDTEDEDKDSESEVENHVAEAGAEVSGNERDSNCDEDAVPEDNFVPVNKSVGFFSIFFFLFICWSRITESQTNQSTQEFLHHQSH